MIFYPELYDCCQTSNNRFHLTRTGAIANNDDDDDDEEEEEEEFMFIKTVY